MLTQTAAAQSSCYVSFADPEPMVEGASSAQPVLYEVVCEEYIDMVTSKDGKALLAVVMPERAFTPQSEWFR